jgi:hypothetical protein
MPISDNDGVRADLTFSWEAKFNHIVNALELLAAKGRTMASRAAKGR